MPTKSNEKVVPDPSAPPTATAVLVDHNVEHQLKEAAALRQRVAMQEQKIAEQNTIINQQALSMQMTSKHLGADRRHMQEDMKLRMVFLRRHGCSLAWSPFRIVPTILMGWAALWVFIWCYVWNLCTNLAMWFALQSLHIFTCFNSPFVEYAQTMTMQYAGQHNCWWWKARYKLEGVDEEHLVYVV